MDFDVQPGSYVVAVSGGVDSMVLLDMLSRMPKLQLTVAHFEHGIRKDSDSDRLLVEQAAARYKLPFIYEHGNLGENASEAMARQARYAFLRRVQEKVQAFGIITAHHQDDLVETAVINMLRGTGRKGLSSLQSGEGIVRPLLQYTKQQIYEYAAQHPEIVWSEDNTNEGDRYLRNYVRHHIIPGLGEKGRAQFLGYVEHAAEMNALIDALLLETITAHIANGELNRYWFIMLPHAVSCEAMAAWLRLSSIREFDRKTIERLVVAAKLAAAGKRQDINAGYLLEVGKYGLRIKPR